jgi:farnesyl diphosphate synthase
LTVADATARSGADLLAEARVVSDGVDRLFERLLASRCDGRDQLCAAMRHAAIGGGKRLRPLLTVAASRLFAIDEERALRAGTAVEAIHVYSLIHDDLPCMDDDDLRRGKPTVHKAFGEAAAVLAGDCFHALAFELLADPQTHEDPFVRSELVLELAKASGIDGMAGGQMMDLAAQEQQLDLPAITRLQQLKTGALIEFAVEAAVIMAKLPPEGRTPYRGYARNVGLAFQIADDLLDHRGDEAAAGKRLHKDAAAGKATFVSLLGEERARAQAGLLVEQAIEHLHDHDEVADLLRAIARYAVERDR